jgi:UDP-glucose 4-epimerase
MKALVTGGVGFIGSFLVDCLIERGGEVRVIDNLSVGSLDNLGRWEGDPRLSFVKGDLLEPETVIDALDGCDVVYHLAANPEVRASRASPEEHFRQNIEATHRLLEAVRVAGGVDLLVFASSSTVYGEAAKVPTPEDYGPLKPISHYGASKLAAEALVSAYASMYGFRAVIFRLANIVGPRSNHGVIYDFVNKLRADPGKLEVLGDGSQSKSYLHVDDCVSGMVLGAEKASERVEVFNLGSDDRVSVMEIAGIVIEEMGIEGCEMLLTEGVDGGRGWAGDVKVMQLDSSKLRSLGWAPRMSSVEAVRMTVLTLVRG